MYGYPHLTKLEICWHGRIEIKHLWIKLFMYYFKKNGWAEGSVISHNKKDLLQEKLEDTKGVIRSRNLKNNRQNNAKKIKDKRKNNDLQTPHRKTKTEQHKPNEKPGVNLGVPRRVSSSCCQRYVCLSPTEV